MPAIERIFITGMPGLGKTMLIRKLADRLDRPFHVFFTGEIRVRRQRTGFAVESFSGSRAVMAHMDIKSVHKVSKYGIDIEAFETVALPEMRVALREGKLILLDEIGRMELFSEEFQPLLLELISRKIPLAATIMYKSDPFCNRLKKMPNSHLITIRAGRTELLAPELLRFINAMPT